MLASSKLQGLVGKCGVTHTRAFRVTASFYKAWYKPAHSSSKADFLSGVRNGAPERLLLKSGGLTTGNAAWNNNFFKRYCLRIASFCQWVLITTEEQKSQPRCFLPSSRNNPWVMTELALTIFFFKLLQGRRRPVEEFLQTFPDLLPITVLSAAVIPRFGRVIIQIMYQCKHDPSSSAASLAQT